MSSARRFRRSASRIRGHHGSSSVTLERGSVSLFETITGSTATLTCSAALIGATSLPISATASISGRLSPGTTIAIAGHSLNYTVQTLAEPSGSSITVSIDPGLEFAVDGEAVTLSPKTLSFTGGPTQIKARDLPAGWTVAATDEIWSLVPPSTAAGEEPREGDRMTSPRAARISQVGGDPGVEYIVLMSPMESQEAA